MPWLLKKKGRKGKKKKASNSDENIAKIKVNSINDL